MAGRTGWTSVRCASSSESAAGRCRGLVIVLPQRQRNGGAETAQWMQQLKARHAAELEQWMAQEQEQLLLRPKFSKQLLQLRSKQESLAHSRDYVAAERVRAQAAQLERVKLDALKASWGAHAHQKRARFLEGQAKEQAGFALRRAEERDWLAWIVTTMVSNAALTRPLHWCSASLLHSDLSRLDASSSYVFHLLPSPSNTHGSPALALALLPVLVLLLLWMTYSSSAVRRPRESIASDAQRSKLPACSAAPHSLYDHSPARAPTKRLDLEEFFLQQQRSPSVTFSVQGAQAGQLSRLHAGKRQVVLQDECNSPP